LLRSAAQSADQRARRFKNIALFLNRGSAEAATQNLFMGNGLTVSYFPITKNAQLLWAITSVSINAADFLMADLFPSDKTTKV